MPLQFETLIMTLEQDMKGTTRLQDVLKKFKINP